MSNQNSENGSAYYQMELKSNYDSLKIISLKASNVMKLVAVQIDVDEQGGVITLAGKNGAGKSSVLNAIAFALGGKEAISDRPIRNGATRAEIICRLSNGIIVTRKISSTGTTLQVTMEDGIPIKSPQAILDALVGNLAFDPLEFSRMDSKKQLETLRKLVGLDFTQMDADRKVLYEERTLVNRDAEKIRARIPATLDCKGLPEEEISVKNLMVELEAAETVNMGNASVRSDLDDAKGYHSKCVKEYEDAKFALKKADSNLNGAIAAYETIRTRAESLVEADTACLRENINSAGEINKKIQANEAARKDAVEALTLTKKAQALTDKINEIDEAKKKAMAEAKFPIESLGFDDDGVTLDGVPFKQGGTAEQITACVAVGMALNPKLRVIFFRDGSLLDDDNLKMVARMAKKNNFQIWMEDARSTNKTAIFIEDGHIKK
jgi:DNA repair ATPase RecN